MPNEGTRRYNNVCMNTQISTPDCAKMVTIKQTCLLLAIGRSQVWCLVNEGRIRTVRIGKRGVRVPLTEIARFIDAASTGCD